MNDKPTAYILIGLPGSGKSTWAAKQNFPGAAYISTDKYVEAYARKTGKTYSEVFEKVMKTAVNDMVEDVIEAREKRLPIVWDQTSLTKASRHKKFEMLRDHYYMIAVVIKTPPNLVLAKRLASRPGKNIPWSVINAMIHRYEPPTKSEGFDEIWVV